MNESKFRTIAGLLIVFSHVFLCIGGYFVLIGKMEVDKTISTLLLLTPIFGIFASQVVNFAAQNSQPSSSRARVSGFFVSIFLLIYVSHIVLISAIFYGYSYSMVIGTPEDLQKFIGIAETAFGFMVGLMVTRVFGAAPQE